MQLFTHPPSPNYSCRVNSAIACYSLYNKYTCIRKSFFSFFSSTAIPLYHYISYTTGIHEFFSRQNSFKFPALKEPSKKLIQKVSLWFSGPNGCCTTPGKKLSSLPRKMSEYDFKACLCKRGMPHGIQNLQSFAQICSHAKIYRNLPLHCNYHINV